LARSDFQRLDSIERFRSPTEIPPFPELPCRDECLILIVWPSAVRLFRTVWGRLGSGDFHWPFGLVLRK